MLRMIPIRHGFPRAVISLTVLHKRLSIHGNFTYIRQIKEGYDYNIGDEIDTKIFDGLKDWFSDVFVYFKRPVIFEHDLDEKHYFLERRETLPFQVRIYPKMDLDTYDSRQDYYGYFKDITLRFTILDETQRDFVESFLSHSGILIEVDPSKTLLYIESIHSFPSTKK